MTSEYADCFKLIDSASKAVVLTGAGVSTLSGIPDFRGRNGVYRNGGLWHGVARETLLSIDFFLQNPGTFYRYAAEELYGMSDKEPSIAHLVLAAAQKRGLVGEVYTQNIDGLHTKAGATTGELHGTLLRHRCLSCGAEFPLGEIRATAAAGEVPRCSCGGLVKPAVVFYGEGLDETLLDRAFDDFAAADLALVFGSSLTVNPAASLPAMTKRSRGRLVIVNEQPTQYDHVAAFRFPDIAAFCSAMREYWNL